MSETANSPKDLGEQAEEAREKRDRERLREYWIAMFLLLATLVAIIVTFGFGESVHRIVAAELLIAVGGLCGGAFLGFLFGIPRAHTVTRTPTAKSLSTKDGAGGDKPATEPAVAPASQGSGMSYEPGNGLEQVSDWLTKVIIGVGLVELHTLGNLLVRGGRLVSESLGLQAPGADIIADLTLVAAATIGFLSSFLWTRVYYGSIQYGADLDVMNRLSGLEEQSNKALTLAAKTASGSLTQDMVPVSGGGRESMAVSKAGSPGLPAEIVDKIRKFELELPEWDSDPSEELFRGATREAGGRKIDGHIEMRVDQALILVVSVTPSVGAPPLEGEVTFLLHPTIPSRVRRVFPKDDAATVEFYSEGWFHVAAILDAGKTVLLLDLRDIRGVPRWFKER